MGAALITTITGATGFLGRRISERLRASGGTVRAVSTRTPPRAEDLEGCDAVIHLAGEPVAQRWTASARERIRTSRVEGTRGLVRALGGLARPPEVLICASAVGYYGSRGDEILTEASAPADDFLGQVCVEWEREAQEAEKLGVRVVRLRIAVVLSREGGALKRMLLPFRVGIGGKIGDGRQWMSWIHIEDLVALACFALATPALRGAVNASAPNPVTNAEFTRELASALHRPAIFPVPKLALNLLYGEMAGIVYASQRVIPEAALASGFAFQFANIGTALRDLL
jgi:uncharacterized protein